METTVPTFIDVFAGAGGLSLGLMMAGWKGLFAVEKSPMAFQTLKHNLIDQKDHLNFEWPDWLNKEAIDIQTLLEKHKEQLSELWDINLLAGGPPCQGFSHSGRRQYDDERNRLFEQYLELVKLISPQMLVVENVQGFAKTFSKTEKGKKGEKIEAEESFNADRELQRQLIELGYMPFTHPTTIKAKDFGIPQLRPRYILIAMRKDLLRRVPFPEPFQILYENVREKFLRDRNLPRDREVTLREAISDLERTHGDVLCTEPGMERFRQGVYGPLQSNNPYQRLMRRSRDGKPIGEGQVADSHRFVNHTPEVAARLRLIISEFRPGIQLSDKEREKLGLNKHRIAPLAQDEACHTLTSLPDDLVHYSEPRIPTVREYARIQSFPDWFEFRAKYTTGDKGRREQVPRYTQVANAVPPLLAEALGLALHECLARVSLVLEPGSFYPVMQEGSATVSSQVEHSEENTSAEAGIPEVQAYSVFATP